METNSHCRPELWGGLECTINRIGNGFRDQLADTGHYQRAGDIEKFAALGISKLRYPLLWERHEQVEGQIIDWTWAQQQLDLIRSYKIEPVAGLLHHGGGPSFTNLDDPSFPEKFASYALKAAKQFPWIKYYTPVNEPLTTARFSGLYGFWYPHKKDAASFARMMIHQVKATVLAMQAIRSVNPDAQLVQTEDLSKTHSTPALQYQADFENTRRWLTYDLLFGKVTRQHYFWNYFISLGIDEKDLVFFIENICPPSIIGFNYYITSERYLDEQLQHYDQKLHGGNERHRYADTEAVRVREPDGITVLLKEAWERYQSPIAVTECHLHCSREEQLRWFREIWDSCCQLRNEGIPVNAVTAWSLLGAYDWNSLLTEQNYHYEPGVFDTGNQEIRPTALAGLISSLNAGDNNIHPLSGQPGWWKRIHHKTSIPGNVSPLLIIGRHSSLGQAFIHVCHQRHIHIVPLSEMEVNIFDASDVTRIIELYKPWAIINTTGYAHVDDAELNSLKCFAINSIAPCVIATACAKHNIHLTTFSSDFVFNGNKNAPYNEFDDVDPINQYGISKVKGEELVMEINRNALIIRCSESFGPWDRYNFVYKVLSAVKNNKDFTMADDLIVSPTYTPDLAHAALDLLIDKEKGIWHLSNEGNISWADFGKDIALRAGYTTAHLHAQSACHMGWPAARPLYSALASSKGAALPSLNNALARYFEECALYQ